jgi:hypothetical protein
MFELEGHNIAAASCGDIDEGMAPFSGTMTDLCDVPQRIVRVNKRMLEHKGNHGQFPDGAGFLRSSRDPCMPQETL